MGQLLQLDVTENLHRTSQHEGSISTISTDINWQQEIVLGNDAMAKRLFFTAYNHYRIALTIAKDLFKAHQAYDNVPDGLVPAVVVSYFNICELWRKQNKTAARKGYLCAAFDYLVIQLRKPNLSSDLQQQIRCGLDKVFVEIIEMGDVDVVAMKKRDLMTTEKTIR